MKTKITLLLLTIFTITSCFAKKLPTKTITITKKDGSHITVNAEIAIKPEDRNFGFMKRKKIPKATNNFFISILYHNAGVPPKENFASKNFFWGRVFRRANAL